MSLIYYKFANEELKALNKEMLDERSQKLNTIADFAKEHGFSEEKFATSNWGGGWRFRGFISENPETVDKKLWKKSDDGLWTPNKRYKEGKELAKKVSEFNWEPKKLKEAVEWTDIFSHNRYYPFMWFVSGDGEFCGIAAPIVDSHDAYTPVEGLEEIPASVYAKYFMDK